MRYVKPISVVVVAAALSKWGQPIKFKRDQTAFHFDH